MVLNSLYMSGLLLQKLIVIVFSMLFKSHKQGKNGLGTFKQFEKVAKKSGFEPEISG
jgi:hypothetical protein